MIDHLLDEVAGAARQQKSNAALWARRAEAILSGCSPKQRAFILDPAKRKSVRCPRRAGKTWGKSSYATYIGEAFPGSRVLIISLTLGSTAENYWRQATAGIWTMNSLYNLGLKGNDTHLSWVHENGSRGILRGADSKNDIEKLRGATAEADLTIIDECKSFAPAFLDELIRDILLPGLMTRQGTLVLGGTPGLIPDGTFYKATCPTARSATGKRFNIPFDLRDKIEVPNSQALWSLHSWTVLDNPVEGQWQFALDMKENEGWDDDHPTWRREFLGEWVIDGTGLVYAYTAAKEKGANKGDLDFVNWKPAPTKSNPTGLPEEDGPWHLVWGCDLGFEDDFGLVVAAYSEQLRELRHVWDFKDNHLTIDEIAAVLEDAGKRFGPPVAIVGDAGALGKLVVESINSMYGIPIQKAEKHEKNDHIELLNSDFHAGRIKIIPHTELENELQRLQWDLSKGAKELLARTGRLREDPKCPNHLCDSLLYLWRFSYHFFARPFDRGAEPGSEEWYRQQEEEAVRKATARRHAEMNRSFITDKDPRAKRGPSNLRSEVQWRTSKVLSNF